MMKFEEFIDIFDNSSKLMLVATYKRLCRLNYSDSSEKVLLKKMFLGLGGGGIKKNKEIAYELWF